MEPVRTEPTAVVERNWSRSLTYEASALYRPTSVAAVQDLVAGAERVKALGARHSFTPVADSPGGIQISLEALDPEVTIEPDAHRAWVGAGMSYGAVAAELQARGYALANMASLPQITIIGGTATGTHGSGDALGILATAIAAVELVCADGSVVTIERGNPDLEAIAVGLGAFGIVTRVALDIEPSYEVRQDLYTGALWDTVLASFDEIMASAYSVSLMANYGQPEVRAIWQKHRIDHDPPPPAETLLGGTWVDDTHLAPGHNLNTRAGTPGPWSDRMAHFRLDAEPSIGGQELQSEYYVAREHGVAALSALRAMGDRIDEVLHGTEIRTVAADELWLSPAHRRASVCIGFTWRQEPEGVEALLDPIEEALAPFDPRPHWGKLFHLGDLDARFPRLAEFRALADRYDPEGCFHNPFLARLGIGS